MLTLMAQQCWILTHSTLASTGLETSQTFRTQYTTNNGPLSLLQVMLTYPHISTILELISVSLRPDWTLQTSRMQYLTNEGPFSSLHRVMLTYPYRSTTSETHSGLVSTGLETSQMPRTQYPTTFNANALVIEKLLGAHPRWTAHYLAVRNIRFEAAPPTTLLDPQ